MPAPANNSAVNATAISSLPYTITSNVADQNAACEMWWKYTVTGFDKVLGFLAFADIAALYMPKITTYVGDTAGAIVAYPLTGGIVASQKQVAFPVTIGQTYWIKVNQTGAGTPLGASLVFSGYAAPMSATPEGSLLVNDTAVGYPAIVISPLGSVLKFIDLPVGDMGVILPTGEMMLEDFVTTPSKAKLYDASAALVTTISPAGDLYALTTDNASTFFIATSSVAYPTTAVASLTTLSKTGVVGGTAWTLPANSAGLHMLGVNSAHTIAYYAKFGLGEAIHAYDLANNVALADLAAGIANHQLVQDLLVLADDTILAGYQKDTVTRDYIVKHYAANGSVLATHSFGTTLKVERLAHALDNPVSYWARFFVNYPTTTIQKTRFSNLLVSDGSVVATSVDMDTFDNGKSNTLWDPTYPAGNPPQFGPPSTCPLMVLRGGTNVPIILPPVRQWGLHRCDTKPRGEQTA